MKKKTITGILVAKAVSVFAAICVIVTVIAKLLGFIEADTVILLLLLLVIIGTGAPTFLRKR